MKSKPQIILVASLLLVVSLIVFARRAAADLYVSDFAAGKIYRYTPDGVGHIFASVPDAKGLAFDAANNLYAASYSQRTIFKIRPNGQKSIFASSVAISYPSAIAFDSAGNLFVSHGRNEGRIAKITPNGTIFPFVDDRRSYALAFDPADYLFATDYDNFEVLKIAPNGTVTVFAGFLSDPTGLAFDSAGNLFVSFYDAASIYKVTPDGFKTKFAAVAYPLGLIFDHSGYLFVASSPNSGGFVLQFAPDGTKSTFATGLVTPSYFAIPNSQ